MGILLWLDDMRPAPEGWVWVKNYEDAVDVLASGIDVDIFQMDHDLGGLGFRTDMKTGYDVIKWMEANNVWPRRIVIHSHNTGGADNMAAVSQRHTPTHIAPF